MTKTLKDWPSNCEADFFDALGQPGSQTFFDFTSDGGDALYYARFHNLVTHESYVIPETHLAGFSEALEKEFKTYAQKDFLGFYDDLEEVWWPQAVNGKRITPTPRGIVGVIEKYTETSLFERVKIVFYDIQKAPDGWVFSSNTGHFEVKPICEWFLDYTFGEPIEESDPEIPDSDMSDPPESVHYRNQVFDG